MTDWHFPAEWEPQEAVWLSWPLNPETWPGKLDGLQRVFAHVAALISQREFVHVNAAVGSHDLIRRQFSQAGGDPAALRLFPHATNDVWCRDHGPIFLKNRATGALALMDWRFNAWGGKFPPWDLDDAVPSQIASALDLPRFSSEMILEGGSIEGNGDGLLLTTRAVLLNPNRNPEWSQKSIERELREKLGATRIFWLERGIEGDDTDGHIDDMTRFFRKDAVVTAVDVGGPNERVLAANRERLQDLPGVEIIDLPMPEPLLAQDWRLETLPASYANFLILNDAVLVPVFDQKARDQEALGIIAECFPGRTITGVDCRDIVWEGGALHCISQQQPQSL